jgi:hypothetical protein
LDPEPFIPSRLPGDQHHLPFGDLKLTRQKLGQVIIRFAIHRRRRNANFDTSSVDTRHLVSGRAWLYVDIEHQDIKRPNQKINS